MEALIRVRELRRQLDALRPLDPAQEARIWQKFRLDWNYHSNNIEGNSLTYGETRSLLLHNITAQGKPLKDHLEITGHNEAIDALLDHIRGGQPVTEAFIRHLHQMLLRERYEVDAVTPDGRPTRRWIEVGQYKSAPNHVRTSTGELFSFAEPFETPARMRDLVARMAAVAQGEADPVISAARFHYEFVCIHPFDDGNGRMARIIMNLLLMRDGYPPAIIKTAHKSEYFSALQRADGGDIEAFIGYIAERVSESLQIMIAGARGEPIDAPGDLDRSIALLSAALRAREDHLGAGRTDESPSQCYRAVFLPLARQLAHYAQRFKDMFGQIRGTLVVGQHTEPYESDQQLTDAATRLTATTERFELHMSFHNLVIKGVDAAHFNWHLRVTMSPLTYTVELTDNDSVIKGYQEIITELEMKAMMSRTVEQQIKRIEQLTARPGTGH